MIRTSITPQQTDLHILLPLHYVGKKLELLVYAVDETEEPTKKNTMNQFWGAMSNQTAKDLHEQTKINRNQWDNDI